MKIQQNKLYRLNQNIQTYTELTERVLFYQQSFKKDSVRCN